ncbi:MAG: transketolase [Candidatus Baldrarchaeia archaeon]
MGRLLRRALNEKQILILSHADGKFSSLNSLVSYLSEKYSISPSTLKLNAKILKDLGLIDYGSKNAPKNVEITELGRLVLALISASENDKGCCEYRHDCGRMGCSADMNGKVDCQNEVRVLDVHQISCQKPEDISAAISVHLRELSWKLKQRLREVLKPVGNWHLGSSLSVLDILLVLLTKWFILDNAKPDDNVLILSKGHCVPALYVILAEFGFIKDDDLKTFGDLGSKLPTHAKRGVPLVAVSTGSLGQGLSVANGIALASKMDGVRKNVYVILGDGELDEGQIWEAAMTAAHYRLDNVIAIVDRNGSQLNGPTEGIKSKEPLRERWKVFGWEVFEVDGHDHGQILDALMKAERVRGAPKVIIAHTGEG